MDKDTFSHTHAQANKDKLQLFFDVHEHACADSAANAVLTCLVCSSACSSLVPTSSSERSVSSMGGRSSSTPRPSVPSNACRREGCQLALQTRHACFLFYSTTQTLSMHQQKPSCHLQKWRLMQLRYEVRERQVIQEVLPVIHILYPIYLAQQTHC